MDIEKYEFFEVKNSANDCTYYVELSYPDYFESSGFCGSLINLYKGDVIALAKHFKLTPEDIKE